jgi:glycosyltransferase involved in cell wall biosynthesis
MSCSTETLEKSSILKDILERANHPEISRIPVSVVIPVKNEGGNIRRCLEHLQWADEIFMVDSQSIDRTIEIADELGAKVVQFHFNGNYPKKKNWALENLPFRNEWVLIVDADEIIPVELAGEISKVMQGHGTHGGYYINRRFFFLGRWIRHCGYYPSYNLRLFKHRLGRYEKLIAGGVGDNEVHEHIELKGKAAYLRHDMLHYAYPDIATWVEKHNRYSNWEAELYERFRSGDEGTEQLIGSRLHFKRLLKRIYLRLPLRFVFRFFYAYIWKRGFLDGKPGFIFCVLLSFYDFLSWAKSYEKKTAPLSS